ncbi:G-type lectin S-receptor-like serine/threonine-protein kinase LECRK3 [Rutidosis leptorrhynchoides]|uniref:G-type lectin S-receptor-like serine/threonine-protein kinase LECRK3 n=1 Tax=Rutidosis leptorrhynchoides TaxID=125765 RepID=UPI003A99CF92
MNDTGNFVLVSNDSRNLWESFKSPSDTLLPTQVMNLGFVMNSKMSRTNFSGGRFQLRLLSDGNLVLNGRDIASDVAYNAYYVSGTNDSSNIGDQLILDANGYLYILRKNGQTFDVGPRETVPSGDYYIRATLDFDGVFTLYYRAKNSVDNTSWSVAWLEPENICAAMRADNVGSGACGFNSVCRLDGASRPICECPKGFSLLDPNDPYGDCKFNFIPNCNEKESDYEENIDFIELANINWPFADYLKLLSGSMNECKELCLYDCFCAVAVYDGTNCWKKRLPLAHGWMNDTELGRAFVKFRKNELPSNSPTQFRERTKGQKTVITVVSALLGSSVFVNVILVGAICLGFVLSYKKSYNQVDKVVETNLTYFSYNELVEATNAFKEQLGKGSFGIVFKGTLGTKSVAVKKLTTLVEDGDKEFKNEVDSIAKTHHRNLVQLLGYCDEGQQRLLVYEYMSNGTLATFLFGDKRPSWEQRSNIALGVAKGLAYLHEECSTQIIHCDIKPQNILLDDNYNPKIADFGLAKLLKMNESRTNTGIRGTKGYVAPEWFRNTPVTTKVDVYSFGVLLLEIVTCRKSVKEYESGNEYGAILTDWAWDCFHDKTLDALVGNDLEALDDHKRLTAFVMVGLSCVQETPSMRPTMRNIIQMLEGVVDVNEPPCAYPFSIASN